MTISIPGLWRGPILHFKGDRALVRGPNSMIFSLVRFFTKWHILLAIGTLRKIRTQRKKHEFGPAGVLQFPPYV